MGKNCNFATNFFCMPKSVAFSNPKGLIMQRKSETYLTTKIWGKRQHLTKSAPARKSSLGGVRHANARMLSSVRPTNGGSPGDVKIAQTVICIIEEFFLKNPEVLLYMCSTDNGQQAQRARLFLHWFNGYEQQKKYAIKSCDIKSTDAEGNPTKEYVALIIQRTHPQFDEIISFFDEEIAMFNENKP